MKNRLSVKSAPKIKIIINWENFCGKQTVMKIIRVFDINL